MVLRVGLIGRYNGVESLFFLYDELCTETLQFLFIIASQRANNPLALAVGKSLSKVRKITLEQGPKGLCSDIILLTWIFFFWL